MSYMSTNAAASYKKIRRCFRIDGDLHILIPELIRRKGLKENLSEFFRIAAHERFNALIKLPDAPPPEPPTSLNP